MDKEIIKDIPGCPGYKASNLGYIISFKRSKPRILTSSLNQKGYYRVGINGRTVSVHTLVLNAFVGPPPDGHECCHNDSNKTNNRLYNLRWDTSKGNAFDRGRSLTPIKIIMLTTQGVPGKVVAKQCGVTLGHVHNVISGNSTVPWINRLATILRTPGSHSLLA